MNSIIQLQEYQKELNSRLSDSEKIDFAKDDWHGPMGTLYEVFFNYGKNGSSLDQYRNGHIPSLKGLGYVEEGENGFSVTTKGEQAVSTYIGTLVDRINQVPQKQQ